MDSAEVVVVGAGPAGLAAASVLAAHGADVVVVDERARPGGQIYRQPPASFHGVRGADATPPAGRALLDDAAAMRLRWRQRTLAWGLFEARDAGQSGEGWVVGLAGPGGVERVAAPHVLV